MRRRKLLVALVGLAVLFVLCPRPQQERLTDENCKRIRKGMSQSEVEAILGKRATTGPVPRDLQLPRGSFSVCWEENELEFETYFDSNGRVLRTTGLVFVEPPDDLFEATLGVPSVSGAAGSRSRPCGGGSCLGSIDCPRQIMA
jgi:hypothetical protein